MSDLVYYQHVETGDRGYLVTVDGKVRIQRLTADLETKEYVEATQPELYVDHEWIIEREERPMTRFYLALVQFEADKALCKGLGLHAAANREWLNLTDEARIEWETKGPKGSERRALFFAIRKTLSYITA